MRNNIRKDISRTPMMSQKILVLNQGGSSKINQIRTIYLDMLKVHLDFSHFWSNKTAGEKKIYMVISVNLTLFHFAADLKFYS